MTMNNINNIMIKLSILLLVYFSTTLNAQDPLSIVPFYHPNGGGRWEVLHENIGVPASQMANLDTNEVSIIDRADNGPSNLKLPGPCKKTDKLTGKPDCTAHALNMDWTNKTIRPLFINSDSYGSSGSIRIDGAILHNGGTGDGANKIRLYKQCDDDLCDWLEDNEHILAYGRRFATSAYLPDGRTIVVGGQDALNYEFLPKDAANPANVGFYDLPFLKDTLDAKQFENNLYPFVHLMPDGNVYIFANQKSIMLDYVNNKVVKTFPDIPGEPRNFPSTGSSAMLPLRLPKQRNGTFPVEIMICGGAAKGNAEKASKGVFLEASRSCGRLVLTDQKPEWKMENMPMPRVMSDLINLPTGDMLLINGAHKGAGMFEGADTPVVNPLLYKPNEPDPTKRFLILNPSNISRMYQSTAVLITDARVVVAGSNPHEKPTTTGKFPTEYRVEAFSPEYLARQYATRRPRSLVIAQYRNIHYGEPFEMTFNIRLYEADKGPVDVMLYWPSFATHSNQMGQRMMQLPVESSKITKQPGDFTIVARAPDNKNIAPAGWYMIYVVHNGLPSNGRWIKLT